MVVAEERPRIALTQSFSKIFKDLGLSPRAVSTTFGCRVNVAVCLQVSWEEEGDVEERRRKEVHSPCGKTLLKKRKQIFEKRRSTQSEC